MLLQVSGRERLLIAEEATVHLPELSLLARAIGRLRCFDSEWVDALKRQVAEYVFDLACVDVFLFDQRHRVAKEAAAVGALVVGELYDDQPRALLADRWAVGDVDRFGPS